MLTDQGDLLKIGMTLNKPQKYEKYEKYRGFGV